MPIKLKKLLEYTMQPGVHRSHAISDKYPASGDTYLVTLRNDAEGRNQLEMLKKALGDEYIVRPRGRHHNRKELLGTKYKPGTQNDVPLEQAEFWAVYLYPKVGMVREYTRVDTNGNLLENEYGHILEINFHNQPIDAVVHFEYNFTPGSYAPSHPYPGSDQEYTTDDIEIDIKYIKVWNPKGNTRLKKLEDISNDAWWNTPDGRDEMEMLEKQLEEIAMSEIQSKYGEPPGV